MRALLLAVCLLAAPALVAQQAGPDPQPTIAVTGEGSVSVPPDMAVVTLGVGARTADAAAAMNEVSQAVTAIVARLSEFGIASADMQTTDLSLSPVYADRSLSGQVQYEGFEASNRLTVRVRDLSILGEVLETVLDDGANQLSGLRFALQDPRPVLDEARRAAMADAAARARLYAEAAGVDLGSVLSIAEPGTDTGRPGPFAMMAEARGVPVEAGETEITARVAVVYALLP